jgi:hypothetical protein
MLRDVAWIMGQVKEGNMTAAQAKWAFIRRINDESAKLDVGPQPQPEPELGPTVIIDGSSG